MVDDQRILNNRSNHSIQVNGIPQSGFGDVELNEMPPMMIGGEARRSSGAAGPPRASTLHERILTRRKKISNATTTTSMGKSVVQGGVVTPIILSPAPSGQHANQSFLHSQPIGGIGGPGLRGPPGTAANGSSSSTNQNSSGILSSSALSLWAAANSEKLSQLSRFGLQTISPNATAISRLQHQSSLNNNITSQPAPPPIIINTAKKTKSKVVERI